MVARFRLPPWLVIGAILALFAGGAWYVRHYVETVVKPGQAAEHREKIAREIAQADRHFQRKRWVQAVQRYEFVLRTYDDGLEVASRGRIHHNIGAALRQEGLAKRNKAVLERSRPSLQAALAIPTPEDRSSRRETLIELGRLESSAYEFTGEEAYVESAISAWRDALALTDPGTEANAHAEIWVLIGNARRDVLSKDPITADPAPALDAYGHALEVSTLSSHPLQHARTQIERAQTFLIIANQKATHQNSTLAVDSLKQALYALGEGADRSTFGRAQKLLGDAYMLIADHPPSSVTSAWRYEHKYRHESLARRAYELAEQAGVSRGAAIKTTD